VDRGVVDEHVERLRLPRQHPNRALIRHVQADRPNALDLRNSPGVTRPGQHLIPERGELPGDLEPKAAVGASDESPHRGEVCSLAP
jgi:hypothetical protein